jgi:S1-C subfamily serine protease
MALATGAAADDQGAGSKGDKSQAEGKNTRSGELMSLKDGQLILKSREGQESTFKVADSAKVTLNDKNGNLKDLHTGDRLRVTIGEDDVVMAIAATRADKKTAQRDDPGRDDLPRDDFGRGQQAVPGQPIVQGQQPDQGQLPAQAGDAERSGRQGPTLGVRIGPSPTTGIQIREVMPQSTAAAAGLRAGDYILTINDDKISSPSDLEKALAGIEPGGEAKFGIWRGGQKQDMSISFAERRSAAFRGDADNQNANDNRDANRDNRDANRDANRDNRGGRDNRDANRNDPRGNRDNRNANRNDRGDRQDQAAGRGWLGVMLVEGPAQGQQQGVLVRNIFPNGPAARAGFRVDDVITKINGEDVDNPQDAIRTIQGLDVGRQVEFTVTRNGETQTLKPTIVDRTQFAQQNSAGGQPGFDPNQRNARGATDFGAANPQGANPQGTVNADNRRLEERTQRLEEQLNQVIQQLNELRQQLGKDSGNRKSNEK